MPDNGGWVAGAQGGWNWTGSQPYTGLPPGVEGGPSLPPVSSGAYGTGQTGWTLTPGGWVAPGQTSGKTAPAVFGSGGWWGGQQTGAPTLTIGGQPASSWMPSTPLPQPRPGGRFNIPFPGFNWTPQGLVPRTGQGAKWTPAIPEPRMKTTYRTTRGQDYGVVGEHWEAGGLVLDPTGMTDKMVPSPGRMVKDYGYIDTTTQVREVEDIDPLDRFKILQDVARDAQNQQEAEDRLALAYEQLGLEASKAALAAQQDAANFQLTLAQSEQKAYEAEQERGFQRWQTETTQAGLAQRQAEQLAAQQAQFQQQLAFDRERMTAELGAQQANRNIQVLTQVLGMWPQLSLAGQSAVRDMLKQLGLDIDNYLGALAGGLRSNIPQPGGARWR